MARWMKDNGLTIALLLLFVGSLVGHLLAGWHYENQELALHREAAISLGEYAADPQFLSSVFENWESEFLQMSAYVVLTAMLFQRGSSESKDPDAPPRDADLAEQVSKAGAPSLLRKGPIPRWVYAHSLGLAMFALFLVSFGLHWWFTAKDAAADAQLHGGMPLAPMDYLFDARLWFESFQNWQSEFFSTAVLIVLSIYLRQRESPESKPVAAPHSQTGD